MHNYNYVTVQVDFMEPRIITGIVTKGISSTSKTGEAWIEAYKITYTNDLLNWNKILDSNSNEQVLVKLSAGFIENYADFFIFVLRFIQLILTGKVQIRYFSKLQLEHVISDFTQKNGTICRH